MNATLSYDEANLFLKANVLISRWHQKFAKNDVQSHLHCKGAPATILIQIRRTHSQFPLIPSPFSLLLASKEPRRILLLRRKSTLPPLHPVRTHQNNLSSPREYALLFYYVVLYSRLNFPILDKTQGCAFYGQKKKNTLKYISKQKNKLSPWGIFCDSPRIKKKKI